MKRLAKLLALGALLGFGVPACSDDSGTPPKADTVLTDGTALDVVVAPDGVMRQDGTAADGVAGDLPAGDLSAGDLPAGDQAAVKQDASGGQD
ncbi:MAG: hypothetical protein KAI47_02010 [Deltaproteobacteria bacterium]|nr:hypothetical protein [Deltaproteobacteria bacterium]